MNDVYISYTRDDNVAAELIAHRLQSEGFSVSFDRDAIVAGVSFSESTIRAIRSASAVLALLSSKSRKNKWVAEELQAALDTKNLVVPVLLDKDAKENWLWPILATRQSVELDFNSPDSKSQLDKLVRMLAAARPMSAVPVPPTSAAPVRPRSAAPVRLKWYIFGSIAIAVIAA